MNGKRATRKQTAPAGKLFADSGIEQLLKIEAYRLEQWFPGKEFRLVPLRDGNFNFVELRTETTLSAGGEADLLGPLEVKALSQMRTLPAHAAIS